VSGQLHALAALPFGRKLRSPLDARVIVVVKKHYATTRMVAGSGPDEVNNFFSI
jgi:hypothetical protein